MRYLSVCSGIESASVSWEDLVWKALQGPRQFDGVFPPMRWIDEQIKEVDAFLGRLV